MLTTPNAPPNLEQEELSFFLGGKTKRNSYSGRQFDRFLKLNLVLPYNPAISFLGICQNELKICLHKNPHMDVYNNFIYNYQNLEAIKVSLSRWVDK